MLNNKKIINLICIFLVFSVLCAASLLTAIVLTNNSMSADDGSNADNQHGPGGYTPDWSGGGEGMDISIDDLDGLLNLDGLIGLLGDINQDIELVMYKIKSTETEQLYLRIKSFGDYNGREWKDATKYPLQIVPGFSATYLPSMVYQAYSGEDTASTVVIDPQIKQYIVPYYIAPQMMGPSQKNDVISIGDASEEYTLHYISSDKINSIPPNVESSENEFESNYRKFVFDKYLQLDDTTRDYMKNLIDVNGFDISDPDIISKVASFIQGSAEYDLNYDRALDSEENIAIAFLEKYKTGICQHYATAATLLFRALGIPARYTVGFSADTIANEWVDVTSMQAHAWVEIYEPGVGWKYVEVTGGSGGGSGGGGGGSGGGSGDTIDPETPKIPVSIYPLKAEMQYDGITTLYAPNAVRGFEEYEEQGFSYQVEISGERIDPGKSTSKIEKMTIYDPEGNDVTDEFELDFKDGELHVFIDSFVFQTRSDSKRYDGTPLVAASYISDNNLKNEGVTVNVEVFASRTNVGISHNIFSVKLYDSDGIDITNNYKIIKIFGELEVKPREITIQAVSDSKKFDGTPLICKEYAISSGQLVDGDAIIKCDLVGSQTEIGRSECAIDFNSIVIKNESGEDVTSNYIIKIENGTLRVTP